MADQRKPNNPDDGDNGDPPEAPGAGTNADMQAMINEQAQIREREEIERQSRGFPAPMVADRGFADNPIEDRLAMLEASGAPPYVIKAEKASMQANRDAWQEQLMVVKAKGAPEAPAPTVGMPGQDIEMLTAAQQENDRILMARMELSMENPPRRNGRTLEEMILTQPDETVPGGFYIVNGKKVDAAGRVLVA